MVKAQCLREKKEVEVKSPKYDLNSIGRAIVRGTCPDCGCSVYRIIKNAEAPADIIARMAKFTKSPKKKTGGSARKRSSRKSSSRCKSCNQAVCECKSGSKRKSGGKRKSGRKSSSRRR